MHLKPDGLVGAICRCHRDRPGGEVLVIDEDLFSENAVSYPKQLPEDQAARLDKITAKPPDAWNAVPVYAVTIPNQPVFLVHNYGWGTDHETYSMIGSTGLPEACGTGRRDLAAKWGLG